MHESDKESVFIIERTWEFRETQKETGAVFLNLPKTFTWLNCYFNWRVWNSEKRRFRIRKM